MRKLLTWTAFVALQLALVEVVSLFGLSWLAQRHLRYKPIHDDRLTPRELAEIRELFEAQPGYNRGDPELGWTHLENGERPPLYRANSHGIRADREYAPKPPPGVLRIAAFGDSFTHASGVGLGDTWHERLMERLPALEVLNFGVGGYGLDQAYLRYRRDGAAFEPHLVFVGFMTENIQRSVNVYRPFYSPGSSPRSKPRFLLQGNDLRLLHNPLDGDEAFRELLHHPERVLPRLGEHDFYFQHKYRPGPLDSFATMRLAKMAWWQMETSAPLGIDFYDPRSEAFQVTSALFDRFSSDVERNGSTPVILIFPDQLDVAAHWKGKPRAYRSMVEHLAKSGHRFLDLLTAFENERDRHSISDLFQKMHYSPLGNQLVADCILEYLRSEGLLEPAPRSSEHSKRVTPSVRSVASHGPRGRSGLVRYRRVASRDSRGPHDVVASGRSP